MTTTTTTTKQHWGSILQSSPEPEYQHHLATSPMPAFTTSPTAPYAPRPRRIRFAPLPDPRRAVLITDDGDELPIPLPDDNTFPTSLLLPTVASCSTQTSPTSATSPVPVLSAASAGAYQYAESLHNDLEGSSGSSTNSYLSSSDSTPRTTTPSEYSPVSSVGSSPVAPAPAALPASLTLKSGDSTTAIATHSLPSPSLSGSPNPQRKGLSLLRPFRKPTGTSSSSSSSSSHSLTPTPSIESNPTPAPASGSNAMRKSLSGLTAEEILTLGTINLFRAGSRDSTDSGSTATATSNNGWGLARWASAGNNTPTGGALNGGSDLFRTQSTQSYKSKSKARSISGTLFSSPLASSSSTPGSSSSSGRPAPPPVSRYKGARMLNGRVYGSKRAGGNPNPFANARDEEPEFVEWGYGGMGSAKGARTAGAASGVNWERLAGGEEGAAAGGPGNRSGNGVSGAPRRARGDDAMRGETPFGGTAGLGTVGGAVEEDDGSGMGWVKRRREERERKAREAKEKEAAEQAAGAAAATAIEVEAGTDGPATDAVLPEKPEQEQSVPPLEPTEIVVLQLEDPSQAEEEEAALVGTEKSPLSASNMPTPTPTRTSTADAAHFMALAASSSAQQDDDATPLAHPANPFDSAQQQQLEDHVPQVVPVPMRKKHSHSHSYSSRDEKAILSAMADAAVLDVVKPTAKSTQADDLVSSSSESASDTDSDSERDNRGDDEQDDDEEDEDDEEEEAEDAAADERRRTMLGAGVEKVMRHKE